MDELEKKEEQEMASVSEEIEEVVEETVEEAVEEAAEEIPVETKTKKEGSGIVGIVAGFAMLIAMLAFVWMSPVGGKTVTDTGVLYAKDNDLYYYDMKNEPYLLQEGIADGGSYHYFYTAWGAGVSVDGEEAYYSANVRADGTYDLYYKDLKAEEEPVEVVCDAVDHIVSGNGEMVAFLERYENGLHLSLFDRDEEVSYAVSAEMTLEEDAYALSKDGKYLVYRDAYDILYATETEYPVSPVALTDDCPLYALAEDMLYFVSKANDHYNIYSYDFKNEPVLVAENAQYMELMPNGRDLLYGVKPTEPIPYSELLVDDMAEIDAAMKETDENYDQKLMRNEIRKAMENGEGLVPMLQQYYVLANGKATLVADNVVSAIAVDSEKTFITGYKAKDFQPIHLSVIGGGLEMVEMIYYMSLNYGGMHPFLADGSGNVETLTGGEIDLDSIKISANGKKAAYLMTDPNTGGNILMQMEIGKGAEAEAVQMDVKEFAFIGGNGPLCYYYAYANGAGTLASVESDRSITDATGVQFAEDMKAVYYISNIDSKTGTGQMQYWDGKGEPVIVDGGVFAFQYKGNGKAAIIYDYDVMKQTGNLGYYDGKGVTMLDEEITGIFIY